MMKSNLMMIIRRYKNYILAIFSLLILIPVFSLNYRDLKFRSDNLLVVNQLGEQYGHHGMLEIYVHLYVGMFLFIVSVISILILYKQFKGSTFTWRPVMAGIFVTGMIGVSESIDHLFAAYLASGFTAFALHNFFNFIHLFGGPMAIFFFYQGTKEYSMQFREGGSPLSKITIILLLLILPVMALLVTILILKTFDVDITTSTVFLISIPTLILVGFTLKESYQQWEMQSFLMGFLSMLSISVSLLFLTILLSINSAVLGNGYLYVLAYSLQNIFHAATASLIILFTISMNVILSEN